MLNKLLKWKRMIIELSIVLVISIFFPPFFIIYWSILFLIAGIQEYIKYQKEKTDRIHQDYIYLKEKGVIK